MLAALVVVSVLAGFTAPLTAAAGNRALSHPSKWQLAMERLKVPGRGCFVAAYPKVAWTKVRCKAAPKATFSPAAGRSAGPRTVGGGADYSAYVQTPLVFGATGSFDRVSTTGEQGPTEFSDTPVPNSYSLQLNSNHFSTSLCSGAATPSLCAGFEQFVYWTEHNDVFIEDWLLSYGATCPTGWLTYGSDCFTDSLAGPLAGGTPTAPGLGSVTLTGKVVGPLNWVVLTDGRSGGHAVASSSSSLLDLAAGWHQVEFNVLGICCGLMASFNPGTSLALRTTVFNGATYAPTCEQQGFSAESNNLNYLPAPAVIAGPDPAMVARYGSSPSSFNCY